MARYDAVVIGAGAEGLVCAAYLAGAGRSVVLVDGAEQVGGGLQSDELASGFKVPATYASVETFDPEITAELDLGSLGLEILPVGGVFVPRPGAEGLYLPPPDDADPLAAAVAAISRLSLADAEAFTEFDGFLRRLATVLQPLLANPLPQLPPRGARGLLALARPALAARRLGTATLAEVLRFGPMPIADVMGERFESHALAVAVTAGALAGSWLGPRSPGSALNLLLHRCGRCRGAIAYPSFARGGSGSLATALAAAARAAGAELRLGTAVERIEVAGGRACAVRLVGGERLAATTVISTADPRTTLLDLLPSGQLGVSFLRQVRQIRGRGALATVAFAVDQSPAFDGAPQDPHLLAGRIHVAAHLDDLERAYDDAKYGRLPRRPYLDVTVPSAADPSLAPAGQHVVHAVVQFPPYTLRQGDWEGQREFLGDVVESTLAEAAPGFSATVLHRRVLTPLDIERRFAAREGCLYQVEPALDQLLWMRPIPGWSRHDTPIEGLWLGGSGSHGGGPLSGLAGRNAARRALG